MALFVFVLPASNINVLEWPSQGSKLDLIRGFVGRDEDEGDGKEYSKFKKLYIILGMPSSNECN